MQVENIMIIDDSIATVEMTKALIGQMDVAQTLHSATSVATAIHSIKVFLDQGSMPELIFLDIELGEQTAFDFLDAYELLMQKMGAEPTSLICILSDNLNKRGNHDKTKNYAHLGLVERLRKPLEPEDVEELLEEHFAVV